MQDPGMACLGKTWHGCPWHGMAQESVHGTNLKRHVHGSRHVCLFFSRLCPNPRCLVPSPQVRILLLDLSRVARNELVSSNAFVWRSGILNFTGTDRSSSRAFLIVQFKCIWPQGLVLRFTGTDPLPPLRARMLRHCLIARNRRLRG